jgi:pimeloyl-ACP methyl ester carboxylesterase
VPSFNTSQGLVHYEVYGNGPPIILIHGWTQAWNTWRSTIESFSNSYRMYAPDLWGFGESEKDSRTSFEVSDFIELIPQLMDHLGMVKVPIMGHSMGGTTALGIALKYPEKVKKVAVVGSPINGQSLSFFLHLAGTKLIASIMLAGEGAPILRTFIRLWSPFVSPTDPNLFYNMTMKNSSGFTINSFFSSIASLRNTNLADQLHKISVPAFGIYGAKDVVVNPNQVKYFKGPIPGARHAWINRAGHFPMWDTPDEFARAFNEFMDM